MIKKLKSLHGLNKIIKLDLSKHIDNCMKVVITPTFQQTSNQEELLQLHDFFTELKENRLIPPQISISQFKLLCYERGLNEYRKDLRVFDC